MFDRINHLEYTGKVFNDKHYDGKSGNKFCRFGLSVSEKQKDGSYKNAWLNCVAFGDSKDSIISKDKVLTFKGRLGVDEYEGKTSIKFIVEEIEGEQAKQKVNDEAEEVADAISFDDDVMPF